MKKYQAQGVAGLEDWRGKRPAKQRPRDKEEALWGENVWLQKENELLRPDPYLQKNWRNWGGGIPEVVPAGTAV